MSLLQIPSCWEGPEPVSQLAVLTDARSLSDREPKRQSGQHRVVAQFGSGTLPVGVAVYPQVEARSSRAARTWSSCPSTCTRFQAFRTTPVPSMRNVER